MCWIDERGGRATFGPCTVGLFAPTIWTVRPWTPPSTTNSRRFTFSLRRTDARRERISDRLRCLSSTTCCPSDIDLARAALRSPSVLPPPTFPFTSPASALTLPLTHALPLANPAFDLAANSLDSADDRAGDLEAGLDHEVDRLVDRLLELLDDLADLLRRCRRGRAGWPGSRSGSAPSGRARLRSWRPRRRCCRATMSTTESMTVLTNSMIRSALFDEEHDDVVDQLAGLDEGRRRVEQADQPGDAGRDDLRDDEVLDLPRTISLMSPSLSISISHSPPTPPAGEHLEDVRRPSRPRPSPSRRSA